MQNHLAQQVVLKHSVGKLNISFQGVPSIIIECSYLGGPFINVSTSSLKKNIRATIFQKINQ